MSPDSSSGEELSEEAPPNYENDIKSKFYTLAEEANTLIQSVVEAHVFY